MTCPNCRFEAPDTELCPNCGYAMPSSTPPGAQESPTSGPVASEIEKSGVVGGCLAAVVFNVVVLFAGGLALTSMSSGFGSPCISSRIVLACLIALSLAIIGLALWRSRLALEFWFTFGLGVFVPFLPCSMAIVSQTTRCPGP